MELENVVNEGLANGVSRVGVIESNEMGILGQWSTTTIITFLDRERGSPSMKSMLISDHGRSGIGSG